MQEDELSQGPSYSLLQTMVWSVFDLPQLEAVDSRYWQLLSTVAIGVVTVLVVAISTVLWLDGLRAAVLGVALFGVILCLFLVYLCRRHAQHLGFGVTELEFISQSGIWWQNRTAMPYSRIQHVTLSQGPLERRYKLASIKCYSAGSGVAEIHIRGLAQDTAEQLRSHLLHKAGVQDA